ncbi:MAG TPA: carbamoyl-phosphate synthase large subunit [Ktedonobacterales bacterium]|jgi:carbamoyl-phosphate synthase large subunit|nr:carbamoyl-phosphate synthase large subunit [Ktedonobacterales bacterium]
MTRDDIQSVLVIGSGPIIIGQAAEFDYAGAQACRALREEGKRVILVNSNPATIMTDEGLADATYIEPLTVESVRRVIARERPDGLLATLGGQTGLNLAVALSEAGVLEEFNVQLLGTPLDTIKKAEDRELFKQLLVGLGLAVPPSKTVSTLEDALAFSDEAIGVPAVIRPAFTLGGTGGGIARTREELARIARRGLDASPIHQILVEQYLGGWKEIEYEVIRDAAGACITVCNMENFDPLGVHTGDSIVVAPSQTLSDKEYQMLRTAAVRIITALGVEGGCNIQFALDPYSFRYYVIEVNPRVSRSSALASKATGYPIARVATKIAIGKRLDEITNEVTGKTVAAFEPALDYVVVKIPRWPFDKFPLADRGLGTQMKATGEVMAIDRTFEAALQKAMRALEVRADTLNTVPSDVDDLGEFPPNDVRLWRLLDSLRVDTADGAIDALHSETGIDRWFLAKLRRIVRMEQRLAKQELTPTLLREAKRMGFADQQIAAAQAERIAPDATAQSVAEQRRAWGIRPTFKMVDTCAGEFEALTPYFYSTYEQENEAPALSGAKAVVLGSGPIRIGQGIEFDYCSVRASQALRAAGVRSIMINSNPETVSTDFDMSDRLYFEPLDAESVIAILQNEAGDDGALPPVVTQFGGQTAIGLAAPLAAAGAPILGTSVDSIDLAEDRRRFDALMERLGVPRPKGAAVTTVEDAQRVAEEIGYPVLVRPSYVLGGRAMEIIRSTDALTHYVTRIIGQFGEHPILIDRYLTGREIEVDAISDGKDVLIPGVMEHIERAGVHSGDSFAVYPTRTLSPDEIRTVARYTTEIARALNVRGLMNIQFVVTEPNGEPGANVWILEVNPRASRTVPFLSKVTGVPMAPVATQVALGEPLASIENGRYVGHPDNLWPVQPLFAVKGPVFSMSKLAGAEMALGPEMKSTGEVMGIDKTYPAALRKALIAAQVTAPDHNGKAFVSVADRDKAEALVILKELGEAGYEFYATAGTAQMLTEQGLKATAVNRISDDDQTIIELIRSHEVQLVINTITGGGGRMREGIEILDGFKIRRAAVEANIPCLTSLDTARALVEAMRAGGETLTLPFPEYRQA